MRCWVQHLRPDSTVWPYHTYRIWPCQARQQYSCTVRSIGGLRQSQQDKEVETEAARQSHYIFWCSIIGIPDPCGNKTGYQHIVAIYAKFVMCGINYYNKDVLWSSIGSICNYNGNPLFSRCNLTPYHQSGLLRWVWSVVVLYLAWYSTIWIVLVTAEAVVIIFWFNPLSQLLKPCFTIYLVLRKFLVGGVLYITCISSPLAWWGQHDVTSIAKHHFDR